MTVYTSSSEKTKKAERITYIDILRTFAILSVIMLHCISDFFINPELYQTVSWYVINILNTLTRTGVPIFFMISGYLLISDKNDTTIKGFFKRRLPKILIPFFIWNTAYYIYFSIQNNAQMSLSDFFFKFVTMDISYHFWFVYTLLCLYLLVPVIKPFFTTAKNTQLLYVLLVITFPTTIGPLINKFSGIWLFRFEPLFLGYAGFFVLGYILGRTDFSTRARVLIYAGGICAALFSVLGTKAFSSSYVIDTFFNSGYGISPYCLGAAFFVFFKQISKRITSSKICAIFSTLGKLSYGVYLSHVLVLNIICHLVSFSRISEYVVCNFLLTSTICFLLSYIISKIKWLKDALI